MVKPSASKWSTRDLMVTIVIGLAFGVLMIPVTNLYAFIRASGPLAQTAVGSLYFVPVAFAAYVMRKPGVVILVSVISGLVVLVTPYGFYALLISIVTGVIGELVFWLLTRYRQVGLGRLLFFGALCGLLEFVVLLRALSSSQFEIAVLAVALGLKACEQGLRILFMTSLRFSTLNISAITFYYKEEISWRILLRGLGIE